MKSLFGIFFLILGFILPAPVVADDLIMSREVFVDAPGNLSIADVATREFSPVEHPLVFGLMDTKTYWLRLKVRAPDAGGEVVLFLRPSYLGAARLYEPDGADPRTWETRVTGGRHPYSERDRARVSLGFVVDIREAEKTVYLQIKANSVARVDVRALTPDEADQRDDTRDLMMVFFATSMVALLLWSIYGYTLDRLPIFALFSLHQAVYTLFGLSVTGYFAPLNYPHLTVWIHTALYCAINVTPVLFCRELFKAYEPPPSLSRGLLLIAAAFPLELAALVVGLDFSVIAVNAVLIRITWGYFVVVALTLGRENTPSLSTIKLFFITLALFHMRFWASPHEILNGETIDIEAIYVLFFDGLFICAFFSLIMHAHARRIRRDARQSAANLRSAQKELERERELKERAEVEARTDHLTGLHNRRRFVELAEREMARSTRDGGPFTLLMIDVDHFKVINDTWGHAVGDSVLRSVANVIRDTLGHVGVFGRTGGEEFAAVIVGMDGTDAVEVGQRLCDAVADVSVPTQTGDHVRVTISIGLTRLNGRNISFDGVLREADHAMYGAKRAGRNRVVVSA